MTFQITEEFVNRMDNVSKLSSKEIYDIVLSRFSAKDIAKIKKVNISFDKTPYKVRVKVQILSRYNLIYTRKSNVYWVGVLFSNSFIENDELFLVKEMPLTVNNVFKFISNFIKNTKSFLSI